MKKLFLGVVLLMMVTGCTGLNVSTAGNVSADMAFALALQNNPTYKEPVVVGLNEIKAYLAGNVTYNDLMLQITSALPGKYAVIAIVLTGYVEADQPVIESIPMLDSYKAGIIKKIDRFILIASAIN